MATRSRIGIQIGNDILSAYHHWDGYPNWLGRILKTHYNTKEKVAELIDGGDMSVAWGDDNKPEYYADRGEIVLPLICLWMSISPKIIMKNMRTFSLVQVGVL